MIRPLASIDLLSCALQGTPGESNRVCTLGSLGNDRSSRFSAMRVSMRAFIPRGASLSWVWRQGGRVVGLVTAMQRSGPKSWELVHLYVRPNAEDGLPQLLDRVAHAVVLRGAERVFLRLQRDDPLTDVARRSGFFPCLLQALYKGPALRDERTHAARLNGDSSLIRKKGEADNYDLFRLYNATTPSSIRQAVGMTYDQWAASRERCRGRRREYVLETSAGVRGWLRTIEQPGVAKFSVELHPDEERRHLATLVDVGLGQLRASDAVYCLVPDYQAGTRQVLMLRGFRPAGDYVTLVKSVSVKAKEDARVKATAAST